VQAQSPVTDRTPVSEETLERLRKLVAHQKSAETIGSLAEAEAFAAKIQELLIKYHVDMAQIPEQSMQSPVGEHKVPVFGRSKRAFHVEQLALVVAHHSFCMVLTEKRSPHIWFVGKEADRMIAEYLFVTLLKQMEELCWVEYKSYRKRSGDPHTKGFAGSFRKGFVDAINLRLKAMERQQPSSTTALMVVDRQLVATYVASKWKGKGNKTAAAPRDPSAVGYTLGRAHGDQVTITQGLAKGDHPSAPIPHSKRLA
jgi:hypothetical protein